MKYEEYPINNQPINLVKDMDALYEAQEIRRLKESILLSDTEKFLMVTRLYKIQQTLKKAKITHKPFIKK